MVGVEELLMNFYNFFYKTLLNYSNNLKLLIYLEFFRHFRSLLADLLVNLRELLLIFNKKAKKKTIRNSR